MDRLEEVSASTNNSSSRLIVIAEISQVVKESAFQPIFLLWYEYLDKQSNWKGKF